MIALRSTLGTCRTLYPQSRGSPNVHVFLFVQAPNKALRRKPTDVQERTRNRRWWEHKGHTQPVPLQSIALTPALSSLRGAVQGWSHPGAVHTGLLQRSREQLPGKHPSCGANISACGMSVQCP